MHLSLHSGAAPSPHYHGNRRVMEGREGGIRDAGHMRGLLVTIVREPRQKGISYCFSGHLLLKKSSMLQLKGGVYRWEAEAAGGWGPDGS